MERLLKTYRVLLALTLAMSGCSKSTEPDPSIITIGKPKAFAPTPAYPDIATLSAMMNKGDISSVSMIDDLLLRSEEYADLNAFITLDIKGAAEKAEELDRLRSVGESRGPLHGIPLVVKDNIHVAGMPNTAGTPGLKDFVPSDSNEVVVRLEQAGAIILGKTNLHELAFGITSNNAAFGAVRNPFDNSLFPGGSSGGTASAISAGIAPAGLGTDTGGSVRIPAALTGIVGFRPSSGRYPSTAVTPISHTRDTVGLLSRTVADLIVLDEVIVPNEEPAHAIAASEIRLGVPRPFYYENLDSETAVVIEATLVRLAEANVQLIETEIPDVGELLGKSAFPIALYEVERELPAYLVKFDTGIAFAELSAAAASPDVQGILAVVRGEGRVVDDVYSAAMSARQQLRKNFREVFANQQLDAIIFPTTPLPARPIEGSLETVELNGEQVPTFPTYIHNTDPASIAALPGISLPVGLTASGLPVGLEIDGPEQSDRRLLAVAKILESIVGFGDRPPQRN
jgi:Asp-tRNA(Asn)/Glu-tRNA(Gln) amidotransferase A subunit family amidase